MKIFRKALIPITVMASLLASTLSLAAGESFLLQSVNMQAQEYGLASQNIYVRALVANRSYVKNVSFLFTSENRSESHVVARYLGPSLPGYELWEAQIKLGSGTYWVRVAYDEAPVSDNQSTYYRIAENAGPILYQNQEIQVFQNQAVNQGRNIQFSAVVKNLAYQKAVKAHIRLNGQGEEIVVPLSFQDEFASRTGLIQSPTAEGFEIWSSDWLVPYGVQSLVYRLSYEVNGERYFDDNFGQGYLTKIR